MMRKAPLAALLGLCLAGSGRADPPPLSTYGNLPMIERVAISPLGKHVAIVGQLDGKRSLVVFEDARKPPIRHDIGSIKLRDVRWIGEDNVLLYNSATVNLGIGFTADKAELKSAFVVPADGSPIWRVFQGDQTITGGVSGFDGLAQRDGKWLGYFGGITLERSSAGGFELGDTKPDLYEFDFATRKSHLLARHFEGERARRSWLVAADGHVAATLDRLTTSGSWRITNATGGTIATGADKNGYTGILGFGATEGTLLYSRANQHTGEVDLIEAPLAGGVGKPFLDDEPIRQYYFDRNRRLIGYLRENDAMDTVLFDARRQKVMKATRKAFPNLNVTLMDYDDAFGRLLVETDGPGDAGTWWLVDIATGDAQEIGSAYALKGSEVGPMRMVQYKAGDGLAMEGVLTLPPGRDPKMLPVVVLPHGGPAARDYAGFDWWAQAFASRGYAVFQPNFRGSTGYSASFESAGNGQWGRKMQTDISDGLAELVRQKIVDPARACIVGASYGGYAALAGVTLQHGLYRCAVAVAGVSDIATMARTEFDESGDDPAMARSLREEFGSGRDLHAVSPVNFAAQADAPILLIHGTNDTVVNFAQSTAMQRALKQAGKPVEFVTLPGEDHWLSRSTTRLAMLKAAVDFVEKNDPPL